MFRTWYWYITCWQSPTPTSATRCVNKDLNHDLRERDVSFQYQSVIISVNIVYLFIFMNDKNMMGNVYILISFAICCTRLDKVSSDSFVPSSVLSDTSDTFIPTEVKGIVEEIKPDGKKRGARKTDKGCLFFRAFF